MKLTLKLVALCLQYPGPGFAATVLPAVTELLDEVPAAARLPLSAFAQAAAAMAPIDLEVRYTQLFDFRKEHALYLTFQEFGETSRRALELVSLQEVLFAGGFEPPEGELADQIPLLLEFLAEKEDDLPDGNLPLRLAGAISKIAAALADAETEPLYASLLQAALAVLPEPGPTITPDGGRLAADETELPYPLDPGGNPWQ